MKPGWIVPLAFFLVGCQQPSVSPVQNDGPAPTHTLQVPKFSDLMGTWNNGGSLSEADANSVASYEIMDICFEPERSSGRETTAEYDHGPHYWGINEAQTSVQVADGVLTSVNRQTRLKHSGDSLAAAKADQPSWTDQYGPTSRELALVDGRLFFSVFHGPADRTLTERGHSRPDRSRKPTLRPRPTSS